MRLPPKIIHQGERPSYWKEMVLDCCKNIHIRERAKDLLLYYCDRSNNFRPSLKEIERSTLIPANKVSEVRKRLTQKGIVGYGNGMIVIDWYRIRNFAMVKPLRKGSYSPAKLPESKLKDIRIRDSDAIDWRLLGRSLPKREYTPQEQTWIHYVENLTESEYYDTLDLIKSLPR